MQKDNIAIVNISNDPLEDVWSGKAKAIKEHIETINELESYQLSIESGDLKYPRLLIRATYFILSKFNLSVALTFRLRFLNQPFLKRKLKKLIYKLQKKDKKVVVHAHDYLCAYVAKRVIKNRPIPIILTVHCFGSASREALIDSGLSESSMFYRYARLIEKEALDEAKLIVVPNEENAIALRNAFPELSTKQNNIIIIPNPTTATLKNPETKASLGVPENYLLIATSANIRPVKRMDLLVEIVRLLRERTDEVRLLIVGDGPERKNLEKLIKKAELEEHIKITGYRESAVDVMNASDVVVMTSQQENFPRTLLEGALLAKPLVAFDVGGVSSIIKNGENGYLVPFPDIGEFAEKLFFLNNHPELRAQMGAKSKQFAQRFSPERIKKDYYELYEKVTNE